METSDKLINSNLPVCTKTGYASYDSYNNKRITREKSGFKSGNDITAQNLTVEIVWVQQPV